MHSESSQAVVPLSTLVEQYLLGRTDGLSAPQVAAFISGWSSALEVVRRVDLTHPGSPEETKRVVEAIVDAIEEARRRVLEQDEDST